MEFMSEFSVVVTRINKAVPEEKTILGKLDDLKYNLMLE